MCLPKARSLIQKHRLHSEQEPTPCSCYEDLHKHDQWLLKLVLKLEHVLRWSSNSFSLDPKDYLPNLADAKVFVRNLSNNLRRIYTDQVDEQLVITILKEVIYFWLDIPNEKKREYRAMMVNIFHSTLGSGALMLPSVWDLCQRVPKWVYTLKSPTSSQDSDALVMFAKTVQILPVAFPSTTSHLLLKLLWENYENFCVARHAPKKRLRLRQVQNPAEFSGSNVELAKPYLTVIADFLRNCWKFTQQSLPPNHVCYKALRSRPDSKLPHREHAPARLHFVRNSLPLDTPKGLFNLLVFRVLMYNSPASRRETFDFSLQSLQTFRALHESNKNRKYYYSSSAYGCNNPKRRDDDLMEGYWPLCHEVWPSFIEENNSKI